MQEFAEAIDLAGQSIELRPDNYEGYYARAKAHLEVNNIADALLDANQAIETSKNASIDIKKILLRLQEDLQQRANGSKLVAESMDTITDL